MFLPFASIGQMDKMDNLKREVETSTDSLFFEEWAIGIHSKKGFGKFEKEEIVEWFIKRTGELNYPVIQGHFIFRKSLQKTINGNYDEALKLIESIIPIFEKYENKLLLSACHNSKGSTLAAIGDIQGGILNLTKAIGFMEDSDIEPKIKLRGMANHYNVLGTIYNLDSQDLLAMENYKKAYKLALKGTQEGSKVRCFCLLNIATMKLRLKDFKSALEFARLSLRESLIGKYNDTYCMGLQRVGLAYSALDQKDSALHYYNLMEVVAYENKYNHYLFQAYKVQAQHYEKHGNPGLALAKHKLYSRLVIEREKEKKKALSNHLVSETKKRDKERADFELAQKIQKEKGKQKNLKILVILSSSLIIILSLFFYIWYQRRKLTQSIKDKKVKIELMQSQIKTIGSQMNPHFVFNALNSVQDLILQKDVRSSSIYLAKFADLMRQTLDNSQRETISIDKEIEILELYLELESLRFNSDFTFSIDKSKLMNVGYTIPAMLLQPYVENAIKHGLLHKDGAKHLSIVFQEHNGKLQCIIQDNGIGRVKSKKINERRNIRHKPFATEANEKRLDLINQSSNNKVSLEVIDLMEGEVPLGTKIIFTFSNKYGS